jgi:UDP-GlcNAc:undecaprenyl-phosphate/decaprenyl-phosphate GlcNAc-1-phosphate transferase
MYALCFLAATSFLLCLCLTPVVRHAFEQWGVLDQPDGLRKIHQRPIARAGGIPLAISYAAAYGLLMISPLKEGLLIEEHMPLIWRMLPSAGLVFATGLLDDIFALSPRLKLAGQVGAAFLAYLSGVRILAVNGYALNDWWSLPLTLAWLVGCTNAFNLIDGVDGLAAGIGLFATLATLITALLQGNITLALATAALAGSLLGFLRYNFNPASIFLGDSGSLLIGFLLGCYGVIWSQKCATLLGMTAPLMALAIPLLDVCLSIVRRFLRKKPIFGADRGHIHHRLLDRGLTPRRVALLLYGICGLAATFSLLASMSSNQYAGVVLILFCAVAWIGVQSLGYVEFVVARHLVFGGELRRLLNVQICLRAFRNSLGAAQTLEECCALILGVATDLGFSRVDLCVAGTRIERSYRCSTGSVWQLRMPFGDTDYVNVSCEFENSLLPMTVGAFAEALHSTLRPRLHRLRLAPEGTIRPRSVDTPGHRVVPSPCCPAAPSAEG